MVLKVKFNLLAVVCFACLANVSAQTSTKYADGMEALQKSDTLTAASCFKESIEKYRDAASFNMLGNLQLRNRTYEARFLALDNLKEAVLREPGNAKYRLDYAKLLIQRNKREGAVEFNNLIKDNTKNINIYMVIAENYKIRFQQGYDWGDYADLFIDGAYDNYTMAEKCYLRALRIDNLNAEVNIGLSELYAANSEFQKSIMLLTKLNRAKPNQKDVNLRLGMYYYKTNQMKSASVHFNKAFSLMSENERRVYTDYTVEMFYPPDIQKKLSTLSMEEKEAYKNKYWNLKDPLVITEENERLIGHYFRVAFSNLYYASPVMKLEGWQSDRGKVLISFGEPKSINTNRLEEAGRNGDIIFSHPLFWTYPDGKNIRFETYGVDNYYWLSRKDAPDYSPGHYYSKMETSGDRFQNYKYEKFGTSVLSSDNVYTTPLQINVFKSPSSGLINVYFSYILPLPADSNKEEHDYCLQLNNELLDIESKKTGKVKGEFINNIEKENRPEYEKINTITTDIKPGKHNFAFETRTIQDSLVSALHKEYDFPSFKKDALDISGLLLASRISDSNPILGAIKRNNIYIIPKIGRRFTNKEPLYLYYEAYNLAKQDDGSTDFEHTITIRESDPIEMGIPVNKIFKSIAAFVTGKSDKISLTTAYKTKEKDSQVYIQLDVGQYKPGLYDISIMIHDKITDQKTERNWQFEIIDTEKMK
jgi:GWxTD domain-containing protein